MKLDTNNGHIEFDGIRDGSEDESNGPKFNLDRDTLNKLVGV